MAGDVLLVHDDVATIAVVRRLLARQGQFAVLATSVADALVAFGHYAPSLVVLAPSVEGGRGALVLRELSQHPNAAGARMLLLGDGVEGSDAPVAPLPLDGAAFLRTVSELMGAADRLRLANGARPATASAAPAPDWWHPVLARVSKPPIRASAPKPDEDAETSMPGGPAEASRPNASPQTFVLEGPAQRSRPAKPQPAHGVQPAGEPEPIRAGFSAGRVTQEQLAQMIADLCTSRSSCRLELKTSEAQRILWLREGTLHSASSSASQESLLSRARADGLIDRQQEAELRSIRGASSADLLGALRTRGYLREVEVVPLVQRWTEQIAIEALGEAESSLRVSELQVPKDALQAASPVPLLQLLPRALYGGLDESSLLESLGGLHAVASPRAHAVEIDSLGLSSKQVALLGAVDGTSRIGEMLLASGLPQNLGLQALHLGKLLGLLEVRVPAEAPPPAAPDLDLRRLRAKFEEVQEGDYFCVLGLPRSAGADDVRRAFQALSAEFNPLKFVGHPDASVHRQAQHVHDILAEAARALQDDRLRAGYSRGLVD